MAVCLHLRATGVYSVLYMGAEGSFKTFVPDSQVNGVPFNVSPTTSALSHKKPCDLKKMFLQLSLSSGDFMKKEMFLQLSLSSVDFMNEGNVFTSVFIFWRWDKNG